MNSFQKTSILNSCRNLEFNRAFAIAKVMGMTKSEPLQSEAETYKVKVLNVARKTLGDFLDQASGNIFFGYAKEIIKPENAERWRRGYAKHMLKREEEMAKKAIDKARAAVSKQLDSLLPESLAKLAQDFFYMHHGYRVSESLLEETFLEIMPAIKHKNIEAKIELTMTMN
jgi:hypothetical protein